MTVDLQSFDAHEQPSDELRTLWKSYQRTDHAKFVNHHPDIDELPTPGNPGAFCSAGQVPVDRLRNAFSQIEGDTWNPEVVVQDAPLYYHPLLPGTCHVHFRFLVMILTPLLSTKA
jgi:hypothetical protein